jgi:hypothetical protein
LVIKDFENIENEQKILLLDALSTVNGKFGIAEKVDIRILLRLLKELMTCGMTLILYRFCYGIGLVN